MRQGTNSIVEEINLIKAINSLAIVWVGATIEAEFMKFNYLLISMKKWDFNDSLSSFIIFHVKEVFIACFITEIYTIAFVEME